MKWNTRNSVRWLVVLGLSGAWALNEVGAGEPNQSVVDGSVLSSVPDRVAGDEISAHKLPSGYRLLYQQSFENAESIGDFVTTDAQAWRIASIGTNHVLELTAQSRYQPPVRSPVNLAMIGDRVFGDFVLECDLMQTGREYGHRDMCLFFGMESATRFYYAHIGFGSFDDTGMIANIRIWGPSVEQKPGPQFVKP
jgi:hypothetical protein